MVRKLLVATLVVLLSGCLSTHLPAATSPTLRCIGDCLRHLDPGPFGAREPAIAVDPTDARRVVIVAQRFTEVAQNAVGQRWFYIDSTTDAGDSWTTTRLPAQGPIANARDMSDPTIAIAADHSIVVGGSVLRGEGLDGVNGPIDLFLAHFEPNAKDLRGDIKVYSAGLLGPGLRDQSSLSSLADGTVSAVFYDSDASSVAEDPDHYPSAWILRSLDNGTDWEAPVKISPHAAPVGFAMGPGGRAAVALKDNTFGFFAASSQDNGAHWQVSSKLGVAGKWGGAAADVEGWNVVVGLKSGSGETPTLFHSSDGRDWSNTTQVTHEVFPENTTFPRIAFAGRTLVATYRESTPSAASYVAVALVPRGAQRLVLDPNVGQDTSDYYALASAPDGSIYAAWIGLGGPVAELRFAHLAIAS